MGTRNTCPAGKGAASARPAAEEIARMAELGLPFDGTEILLNGENFTIVSYDPATRVITARSRSQPHDVDGVDTVTWTMLDSEVEIYDRYARPGPGR